MCWPTTPTPTRTPSPSRRDPGRQRHRGQQRHRCHLHPQCLLDRRRYVHVRGIGRQRRLRHGHGDGDGLAAGHLHDLRNRVRRHRRGRARRRSDRATPTTRTPRTSTYTSTTAPTTLCRDGHHRRHPGRLYSFTGLATDTYIVWVDSKTVPSRAGPDRTGRRHLGRPDLRSYRRASAPMEPEVRTARAIPGTMLRRPQRDSFGQLDHQAPSGRIGQPCSQRHRGRFRFLVQRGGQHPRRRRNRRRLATTTGPCRVRCASSSRTPTPSVGANTMRFVPVEPTDATDGGGNDWWSVPVTVALANRLRPPAPRSTARPTHLTDGCHSAEHERLGPELELNGTGTAATVDGLMRHRRNLGRPRPGDQPFRTERNPDHNCR